MSSSTIPIAATPTRGKSFGLAWVGLCLALAVHVTDEALTDFLSVYNPTVIAIRRHVPLVPFPTFTFRVWLIGLVLGVILLLSLSPFAYNGARFMVPLAYAFGVLMALKWLAAFDGLHLHATSDAGKLLVAIAARLLGLSAKCSSSKGSGVTCEYANESYRSINHCHWWRAGNRARDRRTRSPQPALTSSLAICVAKTRRPRRSTPARAFIAA